MSITRFPPNTIYLGGGQRVQIGDLAASEAITPGMLVERFNNAGVIRWRKSTRTDKRNTLVATDHPMANKGVDDAYAAGDLVEVSEGNTGDTFWMLIASGANIAAGAQLTDAGNGKIKAVGSGIPCFEALENVNNSAGPGDARIRVEVV
jgi:hypothetical protein